MQSGDENDYRDSLDLELEEHRKSDVHDKDIK